MQPSTFANPSFTEASGPAPSWEAGALRHQDAVESAGTFVANGIAADAGRHEPDPDWQPL